MDTLLKAMNQLMPPTDPAVLNTFLEQIADLKRGLNTANSATDRLTAAELETQEARFTDFLRAHKTVAALEKALQDAIDGYNLQAQKPQGKPNLQAVVDAWKALYQSQEKDVLNIVPQQPQKRFSLKPGCADCIRDVFSFVAFSNAALRGERNRATGKANQVLSRLLLDQANAKKAAAAQAAPAAEAVEPKPEAKAQRKAKATDKA